MSRTDHHRPYRVLVDDPLTPLRYQRHYHWIDGTHVAEWALPYRTFVHPPRDYRRTKFHGPQRAAVRVYGRAAVGAHRAGVEIPVEPEGRARHSAKWLWY
jgi:hypothetical protein